MVDRALPGAMPALPAEFEKAHAKTCACIDEAGAFVSKEEYFKLAKQVRAATFSLSSASKPDVALYTLVAKIPGDATTPYAIRMGGEMGIAMPSYNGPGPYTLAMPKNLPAGSYRVCTLSGALLCGLVTVS